MANDVTLPGTGRVIATDDIGGVDYQRIKVVHGAEGSATDTSSAAPFPVALLGEALEAMESMRMAINALTRTIGQSLPDPTGRVRCLIDSISASLTLATVSTVTAVTTVTTVTTVATVTNQTNIGGNSAAPVVPSFMGLAASALRDRIQVS